MGGGGAEEYVLERESSLFLKVITIGGSSKRNETGRSALPPTSRFSFFSRPSLWCQNWGGEIPAVTYLSSVAREQRKEAFLPHDGKWTKSLQ